MEVVGLEMMVIRARVVDFVVQRPQQLTKAKIRGLLRPLERVGLTTSLYLKPCNPYCFACGLQYSDFGRSLMPAPCLLFRACLSAVHGLSLSSDGPYSMHAAWLCLRFSPPYFRTANPMRPGIYPFRIRMRGPFPRFPRSCSSFSFLLPKARAPVMFVAQPTAKLAYTLSTSRQGCVYLITHNDMMLQANKPQYTKYFNRLKLSDRYLVSS
jgi:hypothetical protein